jgi:hypothetical protein
VCLWGNWANVCGLLQMWVVGNVSCGECVGLESATIFFIFIKMLYLYPRIRVFRKIAYPHIRYISYPIPVPVSVLLRVSHCCCQSES